MKNVLIFLCLVLMGVSSFAKPNYAAVDTYAKNAPPLRTDNGLPKLVKYLTKPYQTDEEKARVLLAWLVYNINYDKERLKRIADGKEAADIEISLEVETNPRTGQLVLKRGKLKELHDENTLQKTLKTRKGICKDIAKLYQHMCQLAGLEVEIIQGYACDSQQDFETSEAHMWTAVKINGVWRFIDPTWALQGRIIYVHSLREAQQIERQLRRKQNVDTIKGVQKKVLDEWFLVDEEKIIQTHFPFERRWQLQKRRVTFDEFLRKSCHSSLKKFVNQL